MTAFRSLFLFGAVYSCLVVVLWLLVLFSYIPSSFLVSGVKWHAHEMVFGFARAIILGFIFTAAQNWTGKVLLKGKTIFLIVCLLLLGRFAYFSPSLLGNISMIMDISCDFAVFYFLFPALWSKGQTHNRVIIFSYSLFTFFHLLADISARGVLFPEFTLHFIHMSLLSVVFLLLVIAGRILPFFTAAAIPGVEPIRVAKLEDGILYLGYGFLILELILPWIPSLEIVTVISCFVLVGLHSVRIWNWKPWMAVSRAIVFILHLGYIWIILGYFFLGLSHLKSFPISSVYHLFGYGGVSVFIYGMITRVPLGHTGRKILTTKFTLFAYIILNVGALIRVVLPLLSFYEMAYTLSGILWIFAFGIFLIQFTSILIEPRVDGRVG